MALTLVHPVLIRMVCTSDFDPKTASHGDPFPSEHNSRYFKDSSIALPMLQVLVNAGD
jgi:hypothetical protein